MSGEKTIHILDGDSSRRGLTARKIFSVGMHAEVYEGLRELASRPPKSGLILAYDQYSGPVVPQIVESAGSGKYFPIALYSDRPDPERIVEAMLSGALDYLAWPFESEVFERSFARISTAGKALVERRREFARAKALTERLTSRESEVLVTLVNGASNKDIAKALGISVRTVEIHRANMMRKLGATNTSEAVRIGLIAEAGF